MIAQYLEYRRAPRMLKDEVMRYFAFKYPGQRLFNEEEILDSLSFSLRAHVALHNAREVLIALGVRATFALGTRVRHESRGLGTVTELMQDGRTRVTFDSGEEHRYGLLSMHKLKEEEKAVVAEGQATAKKPGLILRRLASRLTKSRCQEIPASLTRQLSGSDDKGSPMLLSKRLDVAIALNLERRTFMPDDVIITKGKARQG